MRIAEYKQVNTEIVTNTIMVDDYNEAGEVIGQHEETVTKVIPVMGMVYRDATDEENAEAQQTTLAEMTKPVEVTEQDKINALLDSVQVVYPAEAQQGRSAGNEILLPFKVGFRWEKVCGNGRVTFELVPDPNSIGTESNPIIYREDSPLLNNAFYRKDGRLYVYMSGEFVEW